MAGTSQDMNFENLRQRGLESIQPLGEAAARVRQDLEAAAQAADHASSVVGDGVHAAQGLPGRVGDGARAPQVAAPPEMGASLGEDLREAPQSLATLSTLAPLESPITQEAHALAGPEPEEWGADLFGGQSRTDSWLAWNERVQQHLADLAPEAAKPAAEGIFEAAGRDLAPEAAKPAEEERGVPPGPVTVANNPNLCPRLPGPELVDLEANPDRLRPAAPVALPAGLPSIQPIPATLSAQAEALGISPELLEEVEKAQAHRPGAQRFEGGGYDTPVDYPDLSPEGRGHMAHEAWEKLQTGGGYHLLREAGRFGRIWGHDLKGDDAKDQRQWADAAGTPEGRTFTDAMQGIEGLGAKVAELMKVIAAGGDDAGRAAKELAKAKGALDELGKSGRKAAEGLGGEMGAALKGDLAATEKAAGAGQLPAPQAAPHPAEDDQDGTRIPMGGRRLFEFLRHPGESGAGLMQLVGPGLAGRAAFGAADSAWLRLSKMMTAEVGGVAGALGLGAAVGGGLALGWGANKAAADDRAQDADDHLRDVQLGSVMGRDWRGDLYDPDRLHVKEEVSDRGINVAAMRSVLPVLGVSLKNFKGAPINAYEAGQSIFEKSHLIGVGPEAMAQTMGAAISSGQVDKSKEGIETYLGQIAGYTQRAADNGVAANVALGSLAQLNQRQVEALGRLTPESGNLHANLLEALDKTGDPALKGEQGARVLMGLGTIKGETDMALTMGMSKEEQRDLFKRHMLKEAEDFDRMDPGDRMAMLAGNPDVVMERKLKALGKGGVMAGMPEWIQRERLGIDLGASQFHALKKRIDSGDIDFAKMAKDVREGVFSDAARKDVRDSSDLKTQSENDKQRDRSVKDMANAAEQLRLHAKYAGDMVQEIKKGATTWIESGQALKDVLAGAMGVPLMTAHFGAAAFGARR